MRRNILKRAIYSTAALMMAFSMTSCKNADSELKVNEKESISAVSETTVQPVTATETETRAETEAETAALNPVTDVYNPLTGEYGYNEAAVGKRPIAVMINNIDQSLPQYGVGSADYIYEIVVEGGITRMMGVFADYTNVPNVCSVRSCRYYYPIIALGLDAIYCHWGMDHTIAEETLNRTGIDRFDGGESPWYEYLFFNDQERLQYYSSEHTGYLCGSMLPEAIEMGGYRSELLDDHKQDAFEFAEGAEVIKPEGISCEQPTIIFSDSYYSTFTFDSKKGTYKKQHSGNIHIDGATGEQLEFTNVFYLETSVAMRGVGELMDIGLTGGKGYYISNGMAQEIRWSKPAEDKSMIFTDVAGNPLKVNRGKCYFGLTDKVSLE